MLATDLSRIGRPLVAGASGLVIVLAFTLIAPAQAAESTLQVGETAPDFALDSLDGQKVSLSAVAGQGPLVLVVLRGYPGYQCPICSAQVGELMGKAREFQDARSRVILVYPGPSEGLKQRAGEFIRGKTLPENFQILLDPDYTFTKSYGLRWDAPKETAYPSAFVIDGTRTIRFAKISHSHGGRAKAAEILEALKK
jgi:peroxiredoxin Q/BCP